MVVMAAAAVVERQCDVAITYVKIPLTSSIVVVSLNEIHQRHHE